MKPVRLLRLIPFSCFLGIISQVFLAGLSPVSTSEAPVTREDLKPGLLMTIEDDSFQMTRLEPTVAMRLEANESAHPQAPVGKRFRWSGQIHIVTEGKYRFTTPLIGKIQLTIDGKEILSGSHNVPEAKVVSSEEITLAAGIFPFGVDLERTAPVVRLDLQWRGPGFRDEPLPYYFLGHLPASRPKEYKEELQRERGRYLIEERGCVQCHGNGTLEKSGPDLRDIASRTRASSLDARLAHSQKVFPGGRMPRVFTDDESGIAERYATVQYLLTLGKPHEEKPTSSDPNAIASGKKLYLSIGCAACHGIDPTRNIDRPKTDDEETPPTPDDSIHARGTSGDPRSIRLLGKIGDRYTTEALSAFLRNPHATRPTGRMPNLMLSEAEARDIASYLASFRDNEQTLKEPSIPAQESWKAFAESREANKWSELGKKLFTEKGCIQCHAGSTADTSKKLKWPARSETGCLSAKIERGQHPDFSLADEDRRAILAALDEPKSFPSPAIEARRLLLRFQCLNCHARDGEGGIDDLLLSHMKEVHKVENVEDLKPPRLFGVAHKLRKSWMEAVLFHGARARPWSVLRMPDYGPALKNLPEGLAKLEGTTLDDSPVAEPGNSESQETGRLLAGKNGHACVTCHDISGVTGGGARGVDLAQVTQRLRSDWFVRWLHQPQRVSPGTRMPQNYMDGKSLLTSVHDGDADKQIEALRSYFAHGPGLVIPVGPAVPDKWRPDVTQRPLVIRIDTTQFAIGTPSKLHTIVDVSQGSITKIWEGDFLEVPLSNDPKNRKPVTILGKEVGNLPAAGPARGKFLGYSLNAEGYPVFRYENGADDRVDAERLKKLASESRKP